MSVVSTEVQGLDLPQTDGSYKGAVIATLDDGQVITVQVRAPNITIKDEQVAAASIEAQARAERDNADAAVDPSRDPDANGQASKKQVAVAYLRRAYAEEDAYEAWRKFSRFNNFRNAEGLSLAQVQAHLADAGLTSEEWTLMRNEYQYLNGAGRPDTLANARTIQAQWEARDGL